MVMDDEVYIETHEFGEGVTSVVISSD